LQCEFIPATRELKMRIFPSRPDDECSLELWSLDYKKGVFESEFDVKLVATLQEPAVVVG